MPCRLRIKVYEARGLPVNHSSNVNNSDSPGSFVEIKFSDFPPCKTTYKKSLNPVWKEDFRFEISKDKVIQDDPIELRVRWGGMGDEIIGVVYVDINSLLINSGPTEINGWFPIYDTFRGIRGLLHALIKLQFVDNINQFRDSSAGLKFFSVDEAMANHNIVKIIGLVSDVVIENDVPESKYTQRASNEHRLRLLYQISGKLRRKIGIKVQKMGGNSVLGYHQHFEFEGGDNPLIIAKGYGSASLIQKTLRELPTSQSSNDNNNNNIPPISSSPLGTTPPSSISNMAVGMSQSGGGNEQQLFNKGGGDSPVHISTLQSIPSSFSIQYGSILTARSVKTLHGAEREVRVRWWEALREEIKSHARSLNCDLILGYSESSTSFDDVGILTVMGTACKLTPCNNNNNNNNNTFEISEGRQNYRPPESPTFSSNNNLINFNNNNFNNNNFNNNNFNNNNFNNVNMASSMGSLNNNFFLSNLSSSSDSQGSSSVHTSLDNLGAFDNNININNNIINNLNLSIDNNKLKDEKKKKKEKKLKKSTKKKKKKKERKSKQPEIILSTTDLPPRVKIKGEGKSEGVDPPAPLFHARVCKTIRRQEGEQLINEICAMIPQIEFELNTQLIYSLRKRNLNSCFSLTYQLAFRSNLLIYIATGSAFELSNKSFSNLLLDDTGIYQDTSDGKLENFEAMENAYLLEVNSDRNYLLENFVPLLPDFIFPKNMTPFTTQGLPNEGQRKKSKTHMATILTRMKWAPSKQPNTEINSIFQYLYSKLVFQFFNCAPCKISQLKVDLLLDETDIQLLLTAAVYHHPIDHPSNQNPPRDDQPAIGQSQSSIGQSFDHLPFVMESNSPPRDPQILFKLKQNNDPMNNSANQLQRLINPPINATEEIILSYSSSIPGFYIKKYLGRIDHHFIRENKVEDGGAQMDEDACIRESFAIIKAHVASLGANAIIGFKINTILFKRSKEKIPSQTPDRLTSSYRIYGLVSLSGDAVIVRPQRKIPVPLDDF